MGNGAEATIVTLSSPKWPFILEKIPILRIFSLYFVLKRSLVGCAGNFSYLELYLFGEKMATVSEVLHKFLLMQQANHNSPDLLERMKPGMEVQINVSAGDEELVRGASSRMHALPISEHPCLPLRKHLLGRTLFIVTLGILLKDC